VDTTQAQSFFGSMLKFEGRRGRKSYVIASVALLGLSLAVAILGTAFAFVSAGLSIFFMFVGFIALYVMSMIVSAQRIRDFGQSGCWVFLYLIPYLGFAVAFALIFVPPNPGMNKYGPQP
jgi:uncharacterized membrane protein YhaH (DUF805 family)